MSEDCRVHGCAERAVFMGYCITHVISDRTDDMGGMST